MPKSRVKRFFIFLLRSIRIVIMAWMIGIANSIKQEAKFMDETTYKVEVREEQEDDEPFEEL